MQAAAREVKALGGVPFAAYCSDPCDGRTQGTTGMFDSLPYRNDAAMVLGRLIRSLPQRRGVIGVATCDKGLPAMMMALAAARDLPGVIVPGGVTLPPTDRAKTPARCSRSAPATSTARSRSTRPPSPAARPAARPAAAASSWARRPRRRSWPRRWAWRCRTRPWPPAASRSGSTWPRASARAVKALAERGLTMRDILTPASIRNAMVVHAACGGSTNLLLHIPAIAFAAGLPRPTVEEWSDVNRRVPRFVSVLPNGPVNHPTVRVFLAGGVPEIMLHLRELGLLDLSVLTVTGQTLGDVLDWWERQRAAAGRAQAAARTATASIRTT